MQIDLNDELNKKVAIEKIKKGYKTKEEVVIGILEEWSINQA